MSIKVVILSESASFPWGMAAANRVKNLAKSLLSNQCEVEYLGLRGAIVEPLEGRKSRGEIDGITYFYPGGYAVRSTNWWIRRLDDMFGTSLALKYILLQKITGKLDAVIIYSRNYRIVTFWTHFLHFLHIPVVLEMCEWPLAIAQTKNVGFERANEFCFKAVQNVDAVLPISAYIDDEIKKRAESMNNTLPSFVIPILIDCEQDHLVAEQRIIAPYLLYSGSIYYIDIAQIVVDTLYELKCRGTNLTIKFTGHWDKKSFDVLKQYASTKGVFNQLEFTGFVEENSMNALMRGALGLLAPLPENPQSESRFPTKLGYYLASGSPVVTNDIGDVGLYLYDGINAFVAESCDAQQFALKIQQILSNPAQAEKVAETGKNLAFKKFHYSSACKGLGSFLQDVIYNFR